MLILRRLQYSESRNQFQYKHISNKQRKDFQSALEIKSAAIMNYVVS